MFKKDNTFVENAQEEYMTLRQTVLARGEISNAEFDEILRDIREDLACNPAYIEDLLEEYFGLEPDYVFDLLEELEKLPLESLK
jgi:hypothetical protein